jgi:Zn-dependent M28 family amino/carboxypeptidase
VNHVNASGCEASHFVGSNDKIVLLEIKNAGCENIQRALLAEKAGAKALLFYNGFQSTALSFMRVRHTDWRESGEFSELLKIPAFSTSFSTFQMIISANKDTNEVILTLESNSIVKIHETFNILCDIPGKSSSDVIVAGAHLDSVPEGPGLNDDASGSSVLLDIAVQYFKYGIKSHNSIRLAWWGAEEIGLLGSRFYVRDLKETKPEEFKKLQAYFNFDMLGSPNYILGVYDGSFATNENVRTQSKKITTIFTEHFNYTLNPYELKPLISGSDFVPFIEAGIPSGGLFTGAATIKTAEERTKFGGFALATHDPCYHLECDSIENISPVSMEIHAKAAAYIIERFGSIANVKDFLNQK